MSSALDPFLLAFPTLISIVNPISSAFIFREKASRFTVRQRGWITRRVSFYAFIVMVVSLWAGSYILEFFGITLAALRIAGGTILAANAWELMAAPERREARKQEQAASGAGEAPEDIAFFPLTMPFTTGPGTISVAVALGAQRPHELELLGPYFIGVTAAALLTALMIFVTFSFADRIGRALGPTGSRTITRLFAFLLLCIGIQILIIGFSDVLQPLLTARRSG